MAGVVNLNKFRKKKAKLEKEKKADLNRRLHGRTKAERALDEFNAEKERKRSEGIKLIRSAIESEDEPND